MRRSAWFSSIGVVNTQVPTGSFSTKFSLPSFVKRLEKLTEDQRNAIRRVGFGNLLLIPNRTLSKNLLAELMDKWDIESQAFILDVGKITITLLDIALILGLRVVGNDVCVRDYEDLLDVEKEYGADLSKRYITVASLERRLDSLGESVNDDFIRTFLLFVFGTFLFPNSNGKVDSRYICLLKDLDIVSEFAWGKAVHEDILKWLNRRKEDNLQSIGGCLFCLQIWVFEHIDIARPSMVEDSPAFPRSCRWENSKSHQRQWFSTKFKELQHDQIIWTLQPTSEELEIIVIKELMEVEIGGIELHRSNNSPNSVVLANKDNWETWEKSKLETNAMEKGQDVENTSLKRQKTSKKDPVVLRDDIDFPSASSCIPEILHDHVEPDLTSKTSSSDFLIANKDELGAKNQMLEQQVTQMRKENDKLKKENELLRTQLLESSQIEEQNNQLKKEVDEMNKQLELLNMSSDDFVDRLKKILSNEDISDVID